MQQMLRICQPSLPAALDGPCDVPGGMEERLTGVCDSVMRTLSYIKVLQYTISIIILLEMYFISASSCYVHY